MRLLAAGSREALRTRDPIAWSCMAVVVDLAVWSCPAAGGGFVSQHPVEWMKLFTASHIEL